MESIPETGEEKTGAMLFSAKGTKQHEAMEGRYGF